MSSHGSRASSVVGLLTSLGLAIPAVCAPGCASDPGPAGIDSSVRDSNRDTTIWNPPPPDVPMPDADPRDDVPLDEDDTGADADLDASGSDASVDAASERDGSADG